MFVKNMIMKKILMFMAIMIAVVSLSSCNSLEDKAKNSLENETENVAKEMQKRVQYIVGNINIVIK